jgi:hypothetical protein
VRGSPRPAWTWGGPSCPGESRIRLDQFTAPKWKPHFISNRVMPSARDEGPHVPKRERSAVRPRAPKRQGQQSPQRDPRAIRRKVIGHATGDNSNCVVCRPLSGRVGWDMHPKACGTVRSPCWMPDHRPRGPRFDPEAIPPCSSPFRGTRARTICRLAAAALTSPAMAAINRVSCRASSRAQARGRTTLPQQCCPLW